MICSLFSIVESMVRQEVKYEIMKVLFLGHEEIIYEVL